jgi:hypothetical protein
MDREERTADLYKLEYEVAARRYEDIYRAIWQIFSYTAVLAGAILTFGREGMGLELSAAVACIPLLLWYWGVFEPLNKYGDGTIKRLRRVEQLLTFLMGITPRDDHGNQIIKDNTEWQEIDKDHTGLCHYSRFHVRTHLEGAWPRASKVVKITGVIVFAVAGLYAINSLDPQRRWPARLIFSMFFASAWTLLLGVTAILILETIPPSAKTNAKPKWPQRLKSFLLRLPKLRTRHPIRFFSFLLHLLFLYLLTVILPWPGNQWKPGPPAPADRPSSVLVTLDQKSVQDLGSSHKNLDASLGKLESKLNDLSERLDQANRDESQRTVVEFRIVRGATSRPSTQPASQAVGHREHK